MMTRILFIMLASSVLVACSGTTVVLIPDATGKVGQVELKTQGGSTLLSKANESTEATKAELAPSKPVQLSEKEVKDRFAETLTKEPLPPEHFRFYFSSGNAELLPEAKAELDKAKVAIKVRNSCDLSVIGHSDTVGDNEMNRGISLQRAEAVAKAMIGLGLAKECLDIRYYGENDPAVLTADNVDEPQNRRVEIEVR